MKCLLVFFAIVAAVTAEADPKADPKADPAVFYSAAGLTYPYAYSAYAAAPYAHYAPYGLHPYVAGAGCRNNAGQLVPCRAKRSAEAEADPALVYSTYPYAAAVTYPHVYANAAYAAYTPYVHHYTAGYGCRNAVGALVPCA